MDTDVKWCLVRMKAAFMNNLGDVYEKFKVLVRMFVLGLQSALFVHIWSNLCGVVTSYGAIDLRENWVM